MPRRRILVADDMPFNLTILQRMLEQMGHDVTAVTDGEEAVECATSLDYDVILLDLSMPVIDGNLAAQRIRALPNANARIPIFAVTAGEDACAVSFTGILRKPLSRGRIAMALRRVSKQMALGHALKSDAAMVANEVNATCTVDSEIVLEALEFVNAKVRDAMIVRFEAECVRLCRDIQGAVEQEDVTVARSRSHALAGLMGQFGLVAASKVASQIARTAEPQRCLVSTANLAPAVSRGLLEFRRVVGGPGFFAVS